MGIPPFSSAPVATFAGRGLIRQFVFNVKDYGAKGDESTDDTTAIQNALNAMIVGGILFFPQGIYIVSATLTVGVSGVVLMGAGFATGKEGYTATNASVIQASGFSSHTPIFVAGVNSSLLASVILGAGIVGMNFELGNVADGAYFFNVDQAIAQNCYVNGPYTCGIWMGAPQPGGGVDSGRILACKVANAQNHANTVLGYAITANALMFGAGMYYGEIEASSTISSQANGIALGDVNNGPGSCKIIGSTADGAGATGDCFVIAGVNNQLVSSGTWGGPGRSSLHLGPGGNRATNAQIIGNVFQGANINNNQTNGSGAVIFNDSSRGVMVARNQILSGGNPTYAIYEQGVTDGVGARYEDNNISSLGITGPSQGSFANLIHLTGGGGPSTHANNSGLNPIGAVTITPATHAWQNLSGVLVDAYVATAGSYTGTTTLTPSGGSAVTVPNVVVGAHYRIPPFATLTWGVGGAVTTDPTFNGFGN